MSELTNQKRSRQFILCMLLASTSTLAVCFSASAEAKSDSDNDPTVWIELGGQLEHIGNRQDVVNPQFVGAFNDLPFGSPLAVQSPPKYAYGAEGSLLFAPHESNWIFSASLRYGRSYGHKQFSEQTPAAPIVLTQGGAVFVSTPPQIPLHLNATGKNTDIHSIVDFQVGRDVGLGLFGHENKSVFLAGIRFAEFSSHATAELSGVPNYTGGGSLKYFHQNHHRYVGAGRSVRSFRGVGPTVALKASVPLVGNEQDSTLDLDWGINAGVLFGRQKAQLVHQTTGNYYKTVIRLFPPPYLRQQGLYSQYRHEAHPVRSRSVAIPNIGGFAGLSFNYANAKLKLGYRADFFFGAMDGGIDTRKTYDRNFYGPFATVSIGLGG